MISCKESNVVSLRLSIDPYRKECRTDDQSYAIRLRSEAEIEKITKLHDAMYDQCCLFLALKERYGCEIILAETEKEIIRIYRKIRDLEKC